jgi:hypothetical protein
VAGAELHFVPAATGDAEMDRLLLGDRPVAGDSGRDQYPRR